MIKHRENEQDIAGHNYDKVQFVPNSISQKIVFQSGHFDSESKVDGNDQIQKQFGDYEHWGFCYSEAVDNCNEYQDAACYQEADIEVLTFLRIIHLL